MPKQARDSEKGRACAQAVKLTICALLLAASAPHVAAAAALVVASGVVGSNPSAAEVEQRLKSTARDLGAPGYDTRYGWGLLDAGKATLATASG